LTKLRDDAYSAKRLRRPANGVDPADAGALLFSEAPHRRCSTPSESTRLNHTSRDPPLSLPNYTFDRTAGIGCGDNQTLLAAVSQLLR
jgi:hypothetical protein